jgi:hypothetical protein
VTKSRPQEEQEQEQVEMKALLLLVLLLLVVVGVGKVGWSLMVLNPYQRHRLRQSYHYYEKARNTSISRRRR